MNKAWWFWLLFSAPLWAEQYRDPFQPPLTAACADPAVSPEDWRLKGIIGTPDLRYGWVVTPQGQWLGLLPRQRVLDGDWQVMQIQPRQLEFVAQDKAEACRPRTGSVVLTLEKNRKEK
ncbi:hypothetical protein [Serratia fonticola]|uniref:hypothetical protein n=1 Tax=Serratia fonticola TaxID=47917 RepID=UPI0034C6D747